MKTPGADMGIANELIDDIRREHKWSTETLAEICGYSRSRTNYYCNGQATPPAEFLASLFEATRDQRIISLITGRLSTEVAVFQVDTVIDLTDAKAFKQFIKIRKEQTEADSAFLELLEDGIDPTDPAERQRFEKYKKEALEAVAATLTLLKSVETFLDSSRKTVAA